jgi:hypothetical protein
MRRRRFSRRSLAPYRRATPRRMPRFRRRPPFRAPKRPNIRGRSSHGFRRLSAILKPRAIAPHMESQSCDSRSMRPARSPASPWSNRQAMRSSTPRPWRRCVAQARFRRRRSARRGCFPRRSATRFDEQRRRAGKERRALDSGSNAATNRFTRRSRQFLASFLRDDGGRALGRTKWPGAPLGHCCF